MMPQAPSKAAQPTFDFASLLGPYGKRTLLSVNEAAAAMGRKRSYVHELIEAGELHSHRGEGERMNRPRITTFSVIAYLAKTADYTGEERRRLLVDLFRTLSPEERRWALQTLAQNP